ncbi:MAG: hypothetical protein LBI79_10570 [Nitrososphaerota archaeon]|nr:hypothetical protein [Nitrososphaerota archaeon]
MFRKAEVKAKEARRNQYHFAVFEVERLQRDLNILTVGYQAQKQAYEQSIDASQAMINYLKVKYPAEFEP